MTLETIAANIAAANGVIASADPSTWKTPAHMLGLVLQTAFAAELVLGTNLFVGVQPETPNNVITLYDSGGPNQEAKLAVDTHNIAIICRNDDYSVGYNLLNQVKALFQSIPSLTVDGEKIVGIWSLSNIASMGRDKNNLSQFTSNYRVTIDTNKNIYREP